MLGLLSILFFAAAMLFSLGEMGFLTGPLNALTAFILAIVFLVINRPSGWREVPRRRLDAGVILLLLAAALAMTNETWRPLVFVVLPAAVMMGVGVGDPRRRETALLIPTVVFYLALQLAVRHFPYLWWVANTASVAFSDFAGGVVGQQYTFGPTASGFWVMLFAAAWGLSRFIWSEYRNRWKLAVFLLMLVAMGGLVQVLLTPIAMGVQRWAGWMDFILFNSQVLYLLAALLPIAWYRRSSGLDTWGLTGVFQAGPLLLVLVAGLLLGLICMQIELMIYQLDRVDTIALSPGKLVPATEADKGLVADWLLAFDEVTPETMDRCEAEEKAEKGIEASHVYLWHDKAPVSMAWRTRPTRNGIVVTGVYTPPAYRRRGYATACVASLSKLLLDEGFTFCSLYADLANPTSNSVYRKIGYRPIRACTAYDFEQGGTEEA